MQRATLPQQPSGAIESAVLARCHRATEQVQTHVRNLNVGERPGHLEGLEGSLLASVQARGSRCPPPAARHPSEQDVESIKGLEAVIADHERRGTETYIDATVAPAAPQRPAHEASSWHNDHQSPIWTRSTSVALSSCLTNSTASPGKSGFGCCVLASPSSDLELATSLQCRSGACWGGSCCG